MATRKKAKLHYHLSSTAGPCGYLGATTRDKGKVTCKVCKKLVRSKKYLH